MATFLLVWELGRGSGHLVRMLPIAQGLARRGHRVFAAVKDLPRAEAILGSTMVTLIQAPVHDKHIREIQPTLTFAHILYNVGFGDIAAFRSLARRWRSIYDQVQPDLIAFDHSPTALVAARGVQTRRVLLGSGFFCPPDRSPLPNLRPWIKADSNFLIIQEQSVLDRINVILSELGETSLDRITQLYTQVDANFLTTFRELDHYRDRLQGEYWGAWTKAAGERPHWPSQKGKRVYAYLKPFDGLTHLLSVLNGMNQPTLIHCDGIPRSTQRQFASSNIRFSDGRLDLETVGRECDLAILNGNHGTTIALLLAGKPSFHVPITLEQAMLADAVRRMGAGLAASCTQPTEISERLARMMATNAHTEAALRFKEQYSNFDQQKQQETMVNLMERLATNSGPRNQEA